MRSGNSGAKIFRNWAQMLFDTNALIRWLQEPEKLGKRFTQKIGNSKVCYYSPISLFELLQKRDRFSLLTTDNLTDLFSNTGLKELPVTTAHIAESNRFGSLRNTDPFDRILIGQAASEGLDFYTSDQRLLALGFSWIKDSTA